MQGLELLGKMCGFQDTQCACHALLSLPAWSQGLRPSFSEKGHLLTVGGGREEELPTPSKLRLCLEGPCARRGVLSLTLLHEYGFRQREVLVD